MQRDRPAFRIGFSVFLCWIMTAGGCAPSRGPGRTPTDPRQAVPADDVDASRAWMPLVRIEPHVRKPAHPVAQEPLSERAAQFIVQATRLTAQQRFTEAAMKLERALRYDPNHPEIHRVLGWLHWRAGNVERAKTHAARALGITTKTLYNKLKAARAADAVGDEG